MKDTISTQIFDWQQTLRITNQKPEFAAKMISLFLSDLVRAKTAVNNAISSQVWEQASKELHRLYGSCSYCVAPRLRQIIKEFEAALESQDQTQILTSLQNFNTSADELKVLLDNFEPQSEPL
jgi:two-component system sensor histidine kinase BarA